MKKRFFFRSSKVRFLVMAKRKRALLCSSDLRKRSFFVPQKCVFSSWQSESELCFAHLTYENV